MLSEILSERNISDALEHFSKKPDSCGTDGMFLSQLPDYISLNKESIITSLYDGTYEPGIVRMEEHLEKSGKIRMISKLNSIDRFILRAFHQVLAKQLSPELSSNSFAYREGVGTTDAVKQVRSFIESGAKFVVEIDLENFFDNVVHDVLICALQKMEVDHNVLCIIDKFLKSRIEKDYVITAKKIGLIQGSPLSPLLSNLYLNMLDQYMDSRQIQYVRFSDDIKIFTSSYEESAALYIEISDFLMTNLMLPISKEKSGIFNAQNRVYFGYELFQVQGEICIRKKTRKPQITFRNWKTTALGYHDGAYHLLSDGILTRKDFSLLFENQEKKMHIPVEVADSIFVYSKISLSSDFFKFANYQRLIISFFNDYGEYIGSFYPSHQKRSVKYTLCQAEIYCNPSKRLSIAKQIIMAAAHNVRSNLKYYNRRLHCQLLDDASKAISAYIKEMNEAGTLSALMLIEARMREEYYKCFDTIIQGDIFQYIKRSRRPPQNPVNSMISFGNTVLYQKIATEINMTALDIRISFLHAANRRNENLNLDISELFKPIIVDRIIFTLINKHMIHPKKHFETRNDGGVYLNQAGKSVFIHAFQDKIHQKITLDNKHITYEILIRNEIKKIAAYVLSNQEYKPYKYQ